MILKLQSFLKFPVPQRLVASDHRFIYLQPCGDICRSPMAEFIMRDMLKKRGIGTVLTASAATSSEEIGNGVHHGTKEILRRLGIDCSGKTARKMTAKDAEDFDLLIGMDRANLANMQRITGGKGNIKRLLDFSASPRDIADPWFTGDFEKTYLDIEEGCKGLLSELILTGDVQK